MSIRIELAGVPAEVICRHPRNERFFQDYRSARPPVVTIAPTDNDLARTQARLDRVAEGSPGRAHSAAFLENCAIHSLLAEALVPHNVLTLHGSALCMDGDAYVFIAPSGTGKSTHARLWREVFGERVWMINDDKPLLRIEGGAATVYGSPWDGKHHLSRNDCAPLRAVVWLMRDSANRIAPLAKADALQRLMQQAFSSKDPRTMRRILALETSLLDAAEFYAPGCNMTPDAAVTAWKGMNGVRGQ